VEDYDDTRMHAMEVLVDGLLERSRALAPHFWTYAHRYVPTDSVWCEDKSAAEFEERSTPPVIVTDAWEDRLRPVEIGRATTGRSSLSCARERNFLLTIKK
jgi:hypothetical protein